MAISRAIKNRNRPTSLAVTVRHPALWLRALAWLAGALLVTEVALHATGAVSFPLYHADSEVGYIPKANQSGTFLMYSDYEFNDRHMTGGPVVDTPLRKVLVIGDSVVYGGNEYRQADRVGPALQQLMPQARVWTLAAGGWAIRNQLAWLNGNQDVVARMSDVVLVINNTDFLTEAISWGCEIKHPTKRPLFATAYYVRKLAKLDNCNDVRADMRVPDGEWQEPLRQWIAKTQDQGVRVHFVLYPNVADFQTKRANATSGTLTQLQETHPVHAVEVSKWPQWNSGLYRDDIHPNAEGNRVLAEVIRHTLVSKAGF